MDRVGSCEDGRRNAQAEESTNLQLVHASNGGDSQLAIQLIPNEGNDVEL